MLGIKTIGNATLVAYDKVPILSTDPWFGDEHPAYFGSWILTHKIPQDIKKDILKSKYIWFSHGHPDHINPETIKEFKHNKILLPDHYGSRIAKSLEEENYNIEILPDREWVNLTDKIRIKCITTYWQDGILLLDVNGNLFVNLNDASTTSCTRYIRKEVSKYKNTYLLSASGYGDADMINFFDESGKFIVPSAKSNVLVGEQLSLYAKTIGTKSVIPFSSQHQYQRSDSIWAQEYATPEEAYKIGLYKDINFVDQYSYIDCNDNKSYKIECETIKPNIKSPEVFGDSWSEELTKEDIVKVRDYFLKKERLHKFISFINLRVGKKDNLIKFNNNSKRGITFEVPRNSLMTSIEFEIFDDLLIGNFMKTTLHNLNSLYDYDLCRIVAKYGDNGLCQSEKDLKMYFDTYRERAGWEFVYDLFLDKSKHIVMRFLGNNRKSFLFRSLKKILYQIK